MIIESLAVGPFSSNCYFVGDETTRDAVVIDPGDEEERIRAAIDRLCLNIRAILLTHAHLDHIMGVGGVKKAYGAPIMMHIREQELYESLVDQAFFYGFSASSPPPVDRYIHEGDDLDFGAFRITTLETPGHSPGGVSFVLEDAPLRVFSGDALFAGSVGRVDLPGGSFETLERSIREKLYTLNNQTVVYPGHGPATTIGVEKRGNPFIRG